MQPHVEGFDRVDTGEDEILLRVTARGVTAPSLGIYALGQVHRLDLESSLSLAGGLARTEYRVPRALLGSGPATFWLELEDGAVIDLPSPSPAGSAPSRQVAPLSPAGSAPSRQVAPPSAAGSAPSQQVAAPEPTYRWRLRQLMAERGMYSTSTLAGPLASRGVALSTTQVYRLVTGTPERLNLRLLAALCDFLDCSPNDLIELCSPADPRDGDPRP